MAAYLVIIPDISGVDPATNQSLCCCRIILEVAWHNLDHEDDYNYMIG